MGSLVPTVGAGYARSIECLSMQAEVNLGEGRVNQARDGSHGYEANGVSRLGERPKC